MPGFRIGRTSGSWASGRVRPPSSCSRAARCPTTARRRGRGLPDRAVGAGRGAHLDRGGCVGLAQAALDAAARYLTERKAFGGPLAEQQGLRFMLAEMAQKVAPRAPSPRCRRGQGPRRADRRGVVARQVDRLGRRDGVATDAVQLFGGSGYSREPGRADDARREGRPDLRGHQPDPPSNRGGQVLKRGTSGQ